MKRGTVNIKPENWEIWQKLNKTKVINQLLETIRVLDKEAPKGRAKK